MSFLNLETKERYPNNCNTVVSDYINTMKTTYFLEFLLLTSFFSSLYKFTGNQRKAFLIDSFSFFPCLDECNKDIKLLDINQNWVTYRYDYND